MAMPLDGIRIIDWTTGQFGPAATSMLGDFGAEVIKLEQPMKGDPSRDMQGVMGRSFTGLPEGPNFFFESCNRSKRGITVDITREEGREIVYRLVETSDVFVNTFRKPVAAKFGLDYKTLSNFNSRLIYVWGNAFGPDGPDSDKPGVDYSVQARSGIMASVGEPNMPPMAIAGPIADQIGAMCMSNAIVTALLTRERQGVGQEVNLSLLGSMVIAQTANIAARTMVGFELAKHERAKPGNPLWNHYRCADDKWLAFAMLWSARCWPDFCRLMGIQHLQNSLKFNSMEARRENSRELVSILDSIIATKPRHEWIKILDEAISNGADLMYSRLNTISDLPYDPQVVDNDYITTFDHPDLGNIQMVGLPFRLSRTPGKVGGKNHRPAPVIGQHNEEILLELGYKVGDIARLKQQAVI
jgi:CoA:oxalate CoA-transferase